MTKPDFRKKIGSNLGKLGSNLPKFEVFCHFLEFESLDFLDFAYYDRQAGYLTGESHKVGEKKNLGPKFGPFRPNFGPKLGFWLIS